MCKSHIFALVERATKCRKKCLPALWRDLNHALIALNDNRVIVNWFKYYNVNKFLHWRKALKWERQTIRFELFLYYSLISVDSNILSRFVVNNVIQLWRMLNFVKNQKSFLCNLLLNIKCENFPWIWSNFVWSFKLENIKFKIVSKVSLFNSTISLQMMQNSRNP